MATNNFHNEPAEIVCDECDAPLTADSDGVDFYTEKRHGDWTWSVDCRATCTECGTVNGFRGLDLGEDDALALGLREIAADFDIALV